MKIKLIIFLFSIFCPMFLHAQINVSGTVIDKRTNEPLTGVTIKILDTSTGTISDSSGNFALSLKKAGTLEFSMIGFASKEVTVAKPVNNLVVEMTEDLLGLDELVVIGYGSVKKKDLTGAVSVANAEDMKKITATTVTQALQGQVAGVQVKSSGAPGSTGNIYIRGISSLYSDTNPLFVIDGLPTSDTRDFNPSDIESVQVLKDASAAAIYGSRAANGVIIITTKRGQQGNSKIDFSAKYGVQNAVKTFDLMDGPEWLAIQNEKYANAGRSNEFAVDDPTINNNWSDQVFQQGYSEEYNLSASGGTSVSNYLVSANYLKNKGIVIGPDFERISARINGGVEKGRIKIQESALLSTSYSNDMTGSPLTDIIRMPPLIPVTGEDGEYALGGYNGVATNGTNPVAQRNYQRAQNRSYRVQGTINGELRITDWLKYQLNLGLEFNSNVWKRETENKKWYANQAPESKFEQNRNHHLQTVIENLLVFEKNFAKHHVNAIVGYTEQRINSTSIGGTVYDVLQDNSGKYYWSLGNGDSQQANVGESSNPSALRSFLARAIYDYDGRYFLTASLRRDGSSRFRNGLKYGNFPSVSGAWRVSDEKFFEPLKDLINVLKFKVSYGVLGNEAIGNFKYNTYINSFIPYTFGKDENFIFGAMPTVMVDSSLQWEEKKTTNIGVEMAFLNNALTVEADYFINRSNHLLAQVPIPMYVGSWGTIFDNTTTVWRNAGCVENRGFEFSVGYKNYAHPLKFDMKLNLTTIKNKVISLGGDNAPVYGANSKTEVGRSLGELFVLKTDGIYQVEDINADTNPLVFGSLPQAGDQRYLDLFHRDEVTNEILEGPDGIIDEDDRTYVGSPWPKLECSYTFNANWKGIDFSMYWIGAFDKSVYNAMNYWLYNIGDNGNYASGYTGWTEENRSETTPRVYADAILRSNSTRFIERISYARLKSLQVGYNLPESLMKKIGITSCRVYVNAENLITLTNYKGLDPDFAGGGVFNLGEDSNSYPAVRTIGCGLQMSF